MKVQIEFEMDDETYRILKGAVSYLKRPHSGESMTVNEVFSELAEDLAMTGSRPGSLEASNMQNVIDGHGWELHLQSED